MNAKQELDQLNGLWATDRPDLIPPSLKDVFFRIGYPKEDLSASQAQQEPYGWEIEGVLQTSALKHEYHFTRDSLEAEKLKELGYNLVPVYLQSQAQQPTDLSKQLREYAADSGYSHNDYADTMLAAAYEIERCVARLAPSQAQQEPAKAANLFEIVTHGESGDAWLLLRADVNLGLGHHCIKFEGSAADDLRKRFKVMGSMRSQAQQKLLKVSENWRESLSADAMQRLKNLGVIDKSPAPEGGDK